jgi:hypothetical protein
MMTGTNKKPNSIKILVTTNIVAALILSMPFYLTNSYAQGANALEEIVVTARKREESLLEVPLAITALTSADIEARGINEFKDIIAFTPGFHFAEHSVGRADRSNRILVIRGMHISQENDHQQAATVFVDGAPTHGSVIAGLEDAERIEAHKVHISAERPCREQLILSQKRLVVNLKARLSVNLANLELQTWAHLLKVHLEKQFPIALP